MAIIKYSTNMILACCIDRNGGILLEETCFQVLLIISFNMYSLLFTFPGTETVMQTMQEKFQIRGHQ